MGALLSPNGFKTGTFCRLQGFQFRHLIPSLCASGAGFAVVRLVVVGLNVWRNLP